MGLFGTPFQAYRAARAVVRLVKDPTRLDEVFRIADAMENGDLEAAIQDEFGKTPEHRAALRDRPRIGEIDLDRLGQLPLGTLGRSFADFARANGIDPKNIEVNEVRRDFDFVRAHLRETHDVWHVVTDFKTDVAGELGLQAFYLAQFRAPLAAMLLTVGFANTLFYGIDDRDRRMHEIARGWLLGKRARSLFGVRWAELWSRPLEDVRRELGIELDAVARGMQTALGGAELSRALAAAA